MPGAYLTERWAMAVFGGTDLGWRVYEFVLLMPHLPLAMIVIARPYDWLAGLFAAGVFHPAPRRTEGPKVRRRARRGHDHSASCIGYAFLLYAAVRRHRPWLMLLVRLLRHGPRRLHQTHPRRRSSVVHAHRRSPSGTSAAERSRPLLAYIAFWTPARRSRHRARRHGATSSTTTTRSAASSCSSLRVITPSYVALSHPGIVADGPLRTCPVSFYPAACPLAVAALLLNRRWNWEKTALAAWLPLRPLPPTSSQNKGFNSTTATPYL